MCHQWSKGTANLSGAHEFTSCLWGFVLLNLLFLGIVLCQFLSFSFSFLPMYCLSFFDITTSDYSLGIFKFFIQTINTESKKKCCFLDIHCDLKFNFQLNFIQVVLLTKFLLPMEISSHRVGHTSSFTTVGYNSSEKEVGQSSCAGRITYTRY